MDEEQKELLRLRVDTAARNLNEALADAHRFGLRSRISASDNGDLQTVEVTLMRPVEFTLSK